MDAVLHTPRLKLTLITRAERGSQELAWLHTLRSDELSMAWSIRRPSKTIEETEESVKWMLPPSDASSTSTSTSTAATDGKEKDQDKEKAKFRIAYAIHQLPPTQAEPQTQPSHLIGLISLAPLSPHHLVLPPHLHSPTTPHNTLTVELAYALLPSAWGRGFATEALTAVLSACRREENRGFWGPWERVWMRAIVNGRNPRSRTVMRRCGVAELGVYVWKGERIYIGGEWRTEDELWVFGEELVGAYARFTGWE